MIDISAKSFGPTDLDAKNRNVAISRGQVSPDNSQKPVPDLRTLSPLSCDLVQKSIAPLSLLLMIKRKFSSHRHLRLRSGGLETVSQLEGEGGESLEAAFSSSFSFFSAFSSSNHSLRQPEMGKGKEPAGHHLTANIGVHSKCNRSQLDLSNVLKLTTSRPGPGVSQNHLFI